MCRQGEAAGSSRHARHELYGGGGEGFAPSWAAGRRISASSPSLPPSSPPAGKIVEPTGGGANCPVGLLVILRRLLGRVFVGARGVGAEAAGPFRDTATAPG